MTYELTTDQKLTCLHAIVTGRNSREHVARFLEAILQECMTRRCCRVLTDELYCEALTKETIRLPRQRT